MKGSQNRPIQRWRLEGSFSAPPALPRAGCTACSGRPAPPRDFGRLQGRDSRTALPGRNSLFTAPFLRRPTAAPSCSSLPAFPVSLPPVCQLPRRSARPPCSPADPSARRTAPAPSAFLCRGAALAVGALLDPLRQLCREVLPRQKSVTGGAQPRDKANQRKESERFAAGPPWAACAPAEGEGQRAGGELNGEKARRRRPEQERPFTACGSTRQGERD